jgi:FtsH-binding integral membrane protein
VARGVVAGQGRIYKTGSPIVIETALASVILGYQHSPTYMNATVSLRKPLSLPGMPINSFVAHSYRILLLVLAAIAGLGLFSYYALPQSSLFGLGVADVIIWVLCGWLGWRRPIQFVLPLFAVITGLFLGQLAHYFASVFAMATVMTLGAFIGLSAYVHITRKDFSYLRGFLWAAFFILLSSLLVVPLAGNQWVSLGYAAFGSVTFLCWILYDTSQIVHRASQLTPDIAAFELLLDIIGLHRWLLDLLWNAAEAADV